MRVRRMPGILFPPGIFGFGYLVDSSMLPREEFQRLYDLGPEAVYEVLQALALRVKELEDRINKDSHNSSKPPSSDAFKKPKPLRKPSGRRPGGQQGHPGRTLQFAETPDTVVVHRPEVCQKCGAPLDAAPADATDRRQVFDLPPVSLVVTEHRALTCACPACGTQNRAAFPKGVDQPVQYGPSVRALTTYLLDFQLLPYERVVTLMEDLFGASISEGTLHTSLQQAAETLAPVETAIADTLRGASVVHFDETGQRIGGKLHWLHTASTGRLTYYRSHAKRGKAALEAMNILPGFTGRAIHDGWSAYWAYNCRHGLCNAHHLRELTAIVEQDHQPWAEQLKALLLEIKRAVDDAKEQGLRRLHPLRQCAFHARYRALLTVGHATNPPLEPRYESRPAKQSPAHNLLVRLDNAQDAVLAFMYDFSVPFDNNQAERDLRMMKVKQKVSGGFRSQDGADAFNRIRGYVSTLRKQGGTVLSALRSVFAGQPVMPDLTP
jgi:transposase